MLIIENKGILILGNGATNLQDKSTITAEAKYLVNIIYQRNNTFFSLFYANSVETFYKAKAKGSKVKQISAVFENILKDVTANKMKKAGRKGYVYCFSVNHGTVNISDIEDTHKYVMKKRNIV